MNQVLLWVAVIFSVIYGALVAFAGIGQTRAKKIQSWAAWVMIVCGLVVIAAGVLTLLHSTSALWLLGLGLVGIHAITINNGYKMFGKINPSHHIARLVVSIVLFILTYLGLK